MNTVYREEYLNFANGNLNEAQINELCISLIGAEPNNNILYSYQDLDYLYIPETRQLLLELDGEQRRKSKLKHYSIQIG